MEDRDTNKANLAEVPVCETKPIPGAGRGGVWGTGTDCAKQSQFGEARLGSRGPVVRNKANCQRCADREIGVPRGTMQNKPNWRGPAGKGWDMLYKQTQFRRARPPEAGCAKQTQFPAGQDTPPLHYSIIPAFQTRAYRAKQSPKAVAGSR